MVLGNTDILRLKLLMRNRAWALQGGFIASLRTPRCGGRALLTFTVCRTVRLRLSFATLSYAYD